ncbi:GumC family protein [Fischerella thermalis]|uniref:GumC family protein n=1 Tax=Fischerella thermalis TaxID=372787 RepID=UPI000C7FC912|nr:polysaccharide biosynthesis tyrosine autokinase [Fischerella thermalis]PLZ04571.1 capsular biosynthesis protein [Fischerella thermalis WC119]PLZ68196.1 capsular biosynthesis protein [Fischerella thermalis WC246]PLZ76773.1 capsular biosynthesis protein [Fischerella thermalis WC245]
MDHQSYQSSSSDLNQNFLPQQFSNHFPPFPLSETQGDDWNLRDFLSIVRRRALVITTVAAVVMVATVYSSLKQKPVYESSFRLLVEPLNNENKLPELASSQGSSPSNPNLDYESQIQVLKSTELMTSIVRRLQRDYPDINYNYLVNSLTITRLGETKIIEVRYQSEDASRVKNILDQIAKAYLKYSLEQRQTSLRQGLKFVREQLQIMQRRVDQLQKEQQTFRQKYDFVDPETQAQQITDQANNLSQQRQVIDQQLAVARNNLASLQGKEGELAALKDADLYQELLSKLRELDVQIAAETTRLQDENPTVQNLKEKRESLLPLLTQEAQRFMDTKLAEATTQVQALEVQSQELAKVEQQLEQKRKQLPVLTRQYTELQRNLQVATESLNRFLNTRETLEIQVAQAELPWELIQAPTQPENPASVDIKRSLISGLLGGLVLGIGLALLLEKLDSTYHSAYVLKQKIKEPLLGSIPFEKHLQINQQHTSIPRILAKPIPDSLPGDISEPRAIAHQDSSSYSTEFLEALRVLHTNIQLLSSDRPIRSIVMTSAVSGDGKSTVAFHLAEIACAMEQRVLLVDANLRQPVIHELANLSNFWGLSNLITTNLPVTEAIRPAPFMKQLSILTSGPIPPDPTKLLSSEKMKRLMEDFQNSYDLVIYDAPPLLGLADASLLAPHTDGILLVVRMEKTDSSVLKRALDSLKTSRMNVLGVVSNDHKQNSAY